MQVTEVTDSFSLERVVPFFQPIMDLEHNAVWSYECLARLLTIDEQTCLPSEFLYLVERQDKVAELTQTIFNRSANYFRDINMAWNINISLADMSDPTILQFLQSQLVRYPNPERISVEVTAKNALTEIQQFEQFAAKCTDLGLSIVIDHFEHDVQNLEAILALPISAIKVSGKWFEQAKQQPGLDEFIKKLMLLAQSKQIVVIAEHIEAKPTLKIAQEYGVKYAQGFYFSQPKAQH